jgi:hypothetical protein
MDCDKLPNVAPRAPTGKDTQLGTLKTLQVIKTKFRGKVEVTHKKSVTKNRTNGDRK